MNSQPINVHEKFAAFADHWAPRVIADVSDYQLKLVRFLGEFVWHSHSDTDEAFFVLEGAMSIAFRDRQVDLKAGELFVVPRGVEHKPFAEVECKVMLIEQRGVVNTGDAGGPRTAPHDARV